MDTLSKRDRKVLIILIAGVFLGFLNQTLMNTALPSIMTEFHISTSLGQWLINGYMLVNGVMVPLTAFLIQRLKTRTLYLWAMAIFALGTLIAGFAPNYGVLIAGRVVQSIGSGVFGPLMNVVVMNLFVIERRGSAMGIIGLALNFAPTIGPTLSGFIVSNFSWRWLFWGVAPLIIIDLILAFFLLQNIGEQKFLKFNFLGVILSSIGLGSLLYGFSNAGDGSWASPNVWGFIILGMAVTMLFVWQQTHSHVPLLNFDVFRYHNFWVATLINVVLMAALYGGSLMMPLYIQDVKGDSALISGLALMPGAILTAILSPASGKWYDSYGVRKLAPLGMLVAAMGTVVFAFMSIDTPIWLPVAGQILRNLGLVMVLMPMQTEAFNAVPLSLMPDASAVFTTIRNVAASFGTAAMITIYSIVTNLHISGGMDGRAAQMEGIRMAYWVMTILMLVILAMTFMINDRKN